jgi:periplasmic protein TonB
MKKKLALPFVFLAALLFNGALFFFVPFLQAAFNTPQIEKEERDPEVRRDLVLPDFTPPDPEVREIREVVVDPVAEPQLAETRPVFPGGGLAIDLSPVGGSMSLVAGGDRTGLLGAGAGGGEGAGLGAMIYEPGQTDSDARISGPDQPPRYPPRAEREGVTGFVDLLFVVNEAGMAEQISVLREQPQGYGFAQAAIESVRRLRFQPAMLERTPVKQRVRRRINFEL